MLLHWKKHLKRAIHSRVIDWWIQSHIGHNSLKNTSKNYHDHIKLRNSKICTKDKPLWHIPQGWDNIFFWRNSVGLVYIWFLHYIWSAGWYGGWMLCHVSRERVYKILECSLNLRNVNNPINSCKLSVKTDGFIRSIQNLQWPKWKDKNWYFLPEKVLWTDGMNQTKLSSIQRALIPNSIDDMT